MDDIDSKALRFLAKNGRVSWADLGAALGLSPPAAAERVHRLEARKVIRGYAVVVDPRAVGAGLTAFIFVSVATPRHRAAFLERVARLPEILECHHVAGDEDYLIKVRCADTDDLERILTRELKAHDGAAHTRTTIVLSTVKETATPPPLAAPRRPDPAARRK
jgi:Lrp/AsnC family leucine-responsive transcriptional regulator